MVETSSRPLVSVVCNAYNEEENLPVLYERLVRVFEPLGVAWEWLIVDDHSQDRTFEVVTRLAQEDPRVRGIRLSRNFGSHAAKTCGLHHVRGDCAISMASDLQDPPELIPDFLAKWKEGAQVVHAVRQRRLGESASTVLFSRIYCWIMRHVAGLKEFPRTGFSFFLVDRLVVDSYCRFPETSANVHALIHWMGFRQARIPFDQQPRMHGRSGWTLQKKIKLLVDSVVCFAYLPIRAMSFTGIAVVLAGLIYAAWLAARTFAGTPVQGWAAVMAAVLLIGGLQIVMLGVLGEYLWRALSESRRRPPYVIEDTVGMGKEARTAGA